MQATVGRSTKKAYRLWTALREQLDSYISVLICSAMAVTILVGASLVLERVWSDGSVSRQALGSAFFGWCVVTEVWFLYAMWQVVLNDCRPYALCIALRQPRIPGLLRPPLFIWWAYQFLLGLAWRLVLNVYEKQMSLIASLAVSAITSAFSYACFGYLLLSVTVFFRNETSIERLWGWRARWALAHGVIVFLGKVLIDVL